MTNARPLWRCPRCGHAFVQPNATHSCTSIDVAAWIAARGGTAAGALYDTLAALIHRIGPFEAHPQKTRLTFLVRRRFLSINHLSDRGISFHLVLSDRIDDPRVRRHEEIAGLHVHHLRAATPTEIDDAVERLARLAYAWGAA